ncbi:T9SS type A sorting domain-containing protein [Winogradskyella endarachnes]|uniref:T9SS type A sorting domain-containing protein n=1 Tax=Winogradskyella endarachnes TaxID=2681965 RepID=A0A6L6U8T8_9FLAO|nr:T9SS type A sorting domain-containing protein [Winogradskyella endarachnes]MUU78715.1 T9SS type A sorting domain-containing protein [Winogradskyella endarachnes]
MNQITQIKKHILIMLLAFLSIGAQAQNDPFNCDYNAYLFQYNDVYAIDLASGNSYQVAADVTPGSINAAAYNPADGYIWGSLSTPAKTIVRIGNDFATTTYYIDELPDSNRYVGDVSSTGIYYLKGGGTTYYKVDLNPESENYTQFQATGTLSQNINIHDWAFNAVDGQIYAVAKSSNILYRINPDNGQTTALGEVPILSGLNYTYGAVYFDNEGRFYISANQTGTIYVIQSVQTITTAADIDSNLFAFGPSSASNDGARCPTAPVLQEICDNGIDDDGDGLIDCEDPSCSGFGMCEVIVAPTSSSNNGGLESNNRLSEQINARNFKRAKTGYKFDVSTAPRALRTASYGSKSANSGFTLQDFIPLTTINEDEAVEASPSDLIGITNATEIYAVDYLKNSSPVASVLALKTDNGVYEHTKYICDRLLGGELVNVSTIDINDQSFIKAIIKNEDGTFEFVLSLSAKVVNNDANFAIESHWNLDQYEQNVTFYNFQIWSNSIDDLYLLGEEVLNLLNIEKPISTYSLSTPPTVFVKSGGYSDGGLDLQIVNTNGTQSVVFDAGYRTTETEPFQNLNSTINLNGNYITNIRVETGNLFDIGFRIGDGIATPDDLFMSDGPWGIDDSQSGTNVSLYEVATNTNTFEATDFPIERNVTLNATTDSYVAAYRALTPRFQAVDVSDYDMFKFSAQGTGDLEITFVKESISNWEQQFKTTVALTSVLQEFSIAIEDLENNTLDIPELNDVVTIVFTMVAENGTMTTKNFNLSQLRFSQDGALSVDDYNSDLGTLTVYPNPMHTTATINFTTVQNETVQFVMYDQLGKLVYSKTYDAVAGLNNINVSKENLSSGLYFCKIVSSQTNFSPLKLIIK